MAGSEQHDKHNEDPRDDMSDEDNDGADDWTHHNSWFNGQDPWSHSRQQLHPPDGNEQWPKCPRQCQSKLHTAALLTKPIPYSRCDTIDFQKFIAGTFRDGRSDRSQVVGESSKVSAATPELIRLVEELHGKVDHATAGLGLLADCDLREQRLRTWCAPGAHLGIDIG